MTARDNALTVTLPSHREIVMSRVFDAPRELVFRAYTDPQLVARWWGRRHSTTRVDKMDVRPGGLWRYIESGPDGEFAFNGVYREVVPPQRLVYTFEFEPMPGHVLVETITFVDLNGRTQLTSTSVFDTVEDRDGMLQSGMESGANESMDQLDELLNELRAP
jgi:uncharacterized protein YndB with AHSA1/START domain